MTQKRALVAVCILLFLSLTGNFFLGGMLMGNKMHENPRRAAWIERSRVLKSKLSDADKKVMRDVVNRNIKQFQDMRHALDGVRTDIGLAVHAEPFSQPALDSALRAEEQQRRAIFKLMEKTRETVMAHLSPQGRKLLEQMEPPPPHIQQPDAAAADDQQSDDDDDEDDGSGMPPFIWQETNF